jgi:hypothetical protein
MQLNPLDRTANWPPVGADLPAAGANAATQRQLQPEPRASRPETTAIQSVTSQPEPSIKIALSPAFDDIVKREKAAEAKAATNPLADAGPAAAGKPVNPINPVNPEDVYSTATAGGTADGETGARGIAGTSAATSPTEAARVADTGQLPGPDQPSSAADAPSKDWTEKMKAAEDEPPEPPQEPISKKLLDFLQNLWRAGGQAIDVVDEANQALNPRKASDSPLTYTDPSVRKSSGA